MTRPNHNQFFKDAGILALSILVAAMLVRSDVLAQALTATQGVAFLSSVIAGFFFVSIFTTAPATGALIEIFQANSLATIAFFGAIGAVAGDYLMFMFMRDTFSEHLTEVFRLKGTLKRLKHFLRPRIFRRLSFVLGGLIIASPLPDELGLSLLGFSKTKTSWFLPLSFAANFGGILLIGLATRALT